MQQLGDWFGGERHEHDSRVSEVLMESRSIDPCAHKDADEWDLATFESMFYSEMMRPTTDHPPATLWLVNEIPSRMVFAGNRWRVSDTPTRLHDSICSASPDQPRGLYGWRFQGTHDDDQSLVFDVFKGEDGWHVHRIYD